MCLEKGDRLIRQEHVVCEEVWWAMRMEGQAGAKFIQISIQLVLIDHMLHVLFWPLGDTIVNEIEKKKIPTWWREILVEEQKQNKTNKQTKTMHNMGMPWGACWTWGKGVEMLGVKRGWTVRHSSQELTEKTSESKPGVQGKTFWGE